MNNPQDEPLARLHAVVEGQVQGVGFRNFVQAKASLLGLTGWVRNTMEGEVEVLAEGPKSSLDDLMLYLGRGPRSAYVTGVHPEWQKAADEFYSFEIRNTV